MMNLYLLKLKYLTIFENFHYRVSNFSVKKKVSPGDLKKCDLVHNDIFLSSFGTHPCTSD